jgi:uncharacterized delta-60 repeat protein
MKSIGRRTISSGQSPRALNQQSRSQQRLTRAILETLEQRQYLTTTVSIYGSTSKNEGSSYTLDLGYSGTAPTSWSIDWGDGTTSAPDLQNISGNPTSVSHTYIDSSNNYSISATATNEDGNFTANHWTIDSSFGTNGVVTSGNRGIENVVAAQSDGKFIVAGFAVTNGHHFGFYRYNSDGSLDSSFGANGAATTDFSNGITSARAIFLQPDGKILAAGASNSNIALARFDSTGQLDPTFNGTGKVTGTFPDLFISQLVVAPDGKIIVLGTINFGDIVLARYNSDGSLDTTFNGTGFIDTNIYNNSTGPAVTVQPDGKILLASTNASDDIAVTRYNVDGTLDSGFGGGGQISSHVDGFLEANGIIVQPDGKILVRSNADTSNDFALLRYTSNGAADSSFGTNGIVLQHDIVPTSFSLQPDGKIIVTTDTSIYRYNADGSVDPSFNGGSYPISDFPLKTIGIQADGKILALGSISGYFYIERIAPLSTLAVQINNVPPTATFAAATTITAGQSAHITFTNPTDPSSVDTTAGFHYSFATSQAALATTYAAAGTSSSTDIAFNTAGSFTVYGRIFDKDGGHTDYTATQMVINKAAAPSQLVADQVQATQLILTWTDNADDEDGFNVYQSTNGGAFGAATHISGAHSGVDPVQYTVTGLTGGSTYAFRVSATRGNSESNLSLPAIVVTPSTNASRAFIHGPQSAQTGDVINLWADGGNLDGGTGALSYIWNVKKDGKAFGSGIGTTYNFTPDTAATYTADLTVLGSGGAAVAQTFSITVSDAPISATISGPDILTDSHATVFTSSVDPRRSGHVTYLWTAWQIHNLASGGEIEVATSQTSTFRFAANYFSLAADAPANQYRIELTVSVDGQSKKVTKLVTVVADPGASRFDSSSVQVNDISGGSFDSQNRFRDGFGLAEQSNGDFLQAGFDGSEDGTSNIVIVRYTPDLKLDPTFGNNGKAILRVIPSNWANMYISPRVAVAPDGKIVVLEDASDIPVNLQEIDENSPADPPEGDFVVARLNADGTLDHTFGQLDSQGGRTGTAWITVPDGSYASALAVLSDNSIVVGGSKFLNNENSNRWVVAKLTSDGETDTSFGDLVAPNSNVHTGIFNYAGAFTYNVLVAGTWIQQAENVQEIAVDPHGNLVIAGSMNLPPNGVSSRGFAVARLTPGGQLDPTFGGSNSSQDDLAPPPGILYNRAIFWGLSGLVIQPDGKIVVSGNNLDNQLSLVLARFNSDGTLDHSFGGTGIVHTGLPSDGPPGGFGGFGGLNLDSAGNILVSIPGNFTSGTWRLARYKPDGTPDTNFNNGSEFISVSSPSFEVYGGDDAGQVLFTPDGIVTVGSGFNGNQFDFVIFRYHVPYNNAADLRAAATPDRNVALQWIDNGDSEDGFAIYRSLDNVDAHFAEIGDVVANVTSYIDSTAGPGTKYYYKVIPFVGDAMQGPSNVAIATTAPINTSYVLQETVPVEMFGQTTHSQMTLDSNAVYLLEASGNLSQTLDGVHRGDAEYGYFYYLGTSKWWDGAGYDYGIGIDDINGVKQNQWGPLATDVNHTYDAMFIGNGQQLSVVYHDSNYPDNTVSNPGDIPLTVKIYRALPSSPAFLTTDADRVNKQINLSWQNLATDGRHILIERSEDDGAFTQIASVSASSTTFTDTGGDTASGKLDLNHKYTYRIRVQNNFGDSGYSKEAYAVLANLPPTIKQIPAQVARVGTPFVMKVDASDPEDGTSGLVYSIADTSHTPGLIASTSSPGIFSGWTPGASDLGKSYVLKVRVADQDSTDASPSFTEQSFTITVAPNTSTIPQVTVNVTPDSDDTKLDLTAVATDDGPTSNLTYSWAAIRVPPGVAAPTFETPTGASTIADLHGAGLYIFRATVSDGTEFPGTGDSAVFDMVQQLTSITVSPASPSVTPGGTLLLKPAGFDQFNRSMSYGLLHWHFTSHAAGGSLSDTTPTGMIDPDEFVSSVLYHAPATLSSSQNDEIHVSSTFAPAVYKDVEITVAATANQPPQIVNEADVNALNLNQLQLSVLASDDGPESDLTYHWDITDASGNPAQVQLSDNDTNSAKNAIATFPSVGPFNYTFVVTITDKQGGQVTSNIEVTDEQDLSEIDLTLARNTFTQSDSSHTRTTTFTAVAKDQDVRTFIPQPSFVWKIDGQVQSGVTGANFTYTIPTTAGNHTVTASATLGSQTATQTQSFSIVGQAAPTYAIISPSPTQGNSPALISADTSVSIVADDPNSDVGEQASWSLWLISQDGSKILLNSGDNHSAGSAPSNGSVVATLHPTDIADGLYSLNLYSDTSGTHLVDSKSLQIKSNFKLGSFHLPVTDLTVNLPGGGQLTATRVYDSMNADQNSPIGFGWKLLLNNSSVTTTATPGDHDTRIGSTTYDGLRQGDLVYINLPGGSQRVFAFIPKPLNYSVGQPDIAYFTYVPQFVSVDGSGDTLSVPGDTHSDVDDQVTLVRDGDQFYGEDNGEGYNPAIGGANGFGGTYTLQTSDGTTYTINAATGKTTSSVDSNGNTTSYGASTSSAGMQLKSGAVQSSLGNYEVYVADASGNAIASIAPVYYTIDSSGNLTAVQGQDGNVTTYQYNATHYLTKVIDPRGIATLSAQYDPASGMLIKLTDAAGNAAPISQPSFNGDGSTASQNVTDPAGGATENIYDDHGNVIRQIQTIKDASGQVSGYMVSVHDYTYAPFDVNDAYQTGASAANTLVSSTDYEPVFVQASQRYTVMPTQVMRTISYRAGAGENGQSLPGIETTYDANGHAITTTFGNYSDGKPESIQTVHNGVTTTTSNTYDVDGNLLTSTDPNGTVTNYTYSDGSGGVLKGLLLTSSQVRGGHTITLSSNKYYGTSASSFTIVPSQSYEVGRLASSTDVNGITHNYTYDSAGNQISDSYISNGQFVENDTQYDSSGRVISTTTGKVSRISDGVILKAGITNSTHYNSVGQVDYTTDQYGGVTHNYYDVLGNVVRVTYPDNTETRTAYDAMNRPYLTMDRFNPADGSSANGTLTIYDSLGRVTSTQRLSGVQINVNIDSSTSIATATVARSGTLRSSTTTLYDSAGRVVETDNSSGLENGTLYYPNGQVEYSGVLSATAISIGSGNWESLGDPHQIFSSYTYYQYDKTDNLPTGAVSYDSVTDAKNHTTKTYKNALGQVIKTVYDNGKSVSETYDAQGNKSSQTDELGRTTTYKYDDAGQLIEVDQPQVADPAHPSNLVTPVTKYTYDANGDELTQTDANNHTTTFTYDALGDELTRTLPGGESESFTYDSFGRESTHTDFDGNVATYHYDSLGREDQVTYTGATGSGKTTQTVTYTYDDLGRQHSVTDASGTTTYSYDADGNEIEADTPEGNIHYVYDNLDQHVETFTDNTDIVYGYDTQGRLTTTTVKKLNGTTLSTPLVTTNNYDAVGDKTSEILPSGVETDYTYDDLNRLTDVLEKKGTTTLFSQHYILNDDGTRASDTESELQSDGSTETISSAWSYDALDRLTSESVTSNVSAHSFNDSYTYDLVGNRLTKTHTGPGGGASDTITSTYNGDDQLTSEVSTLNGETDFTYDANGSQTNDGNHKYIYDVRNRLLQVTDESNNAIASYVYDDAGNRVRETTGGATTFYLTDSNNPTGYAQPIEQKSSATSAPTITYMIGDRILAQANASGGMTYLLQDGGGSTRLLSSSTGAVISTLNYAAFGEAINFDPTTIGTIFQFGGDSMYDIASGLNFHGSGRQSQDYRFISRDDPGYQDNFNPITLNLTLLDGADLVNMRDPSGHFFDLVGLSVGVGISSLVGGLTAGAINKFTGGSFWEGFEKGVASTAITGLAFALFPEFPFVDNAFGNIAGTLIVDSINGNLENNPGRTIVSDVFGGLLAAVGSKVVGVMFDFEGTPMTMSQIATSSEADQAIQAIKIKFGYYPPGFKLLSAAERIATLKTLNDALQKTLKAIYEQATKEAGAGVAFGAPINAATRIVGKIFDLLSGKV